MLVHIRVMFRWPQKWETIMLYQLGHDTKHEVSKAQNVTALVYVVKGYILTSVAVCLCVCVCVCGGGALCH